MEPIVVGLSHASRRCAKGEFKHTVNSQGAGGNPANLANQKCTDPAADMKCLNESMAKQGCNISPVSNKDNAYSFASECQMHGVSIRSQSVITVESDSAYTTQVNVCLLSVRPVRFGLLPTTPFATCQNASSLDLSITRSQ